MIRITGGHFRGRYLETPKGNQTRPTSSRIRSALASILGSRIQDARVLDVCAGSGAFGFECLSRGASHATFIEENYRVVSILKKNATSLGIKDAIRIFHVKAETWIRSAIEPNFDIVFVDPPYALTSTITLRLDPSKLLKDQGVMIIETGKDVTLPEFDGIHLCDRRCYGDTTLHFFQKNLSLSPQKR